MNSHKATFPLPCIKKPCARSGMSREIVAGNLIGRKTNLEPFLVRNAYRLARIKNLKNLNIGTDRPMQTA